MVTASIPDETISRQTDIFCNKNLKLSLTWILGYDAVTLRKELRYFFFIFLPLSSRVTNRKERDGGFLSWMTRHHELRKKINDFFPKTLHAQRKNYLFTKWHAIIWLIFHNFVWINSTIVPQLCRRDNPIVPLIYPGIPGIPTRTKRVGVFFSLITSKIGALEKFQAFTPKAWAFTKMKGVFAQKKFELIFGHDTDGQKNAAINTFEQKKFFPQLLRENLRHALA